MAMAQSYQDEGTDVVLSIDDVATVQDEQVLLPEKSRGQAATIRSVRSLTGHRAHVLLAVFFFFFKPWPTLTAHHARGARACIVTGTSVDCAALDLDMLRPPAPQKRVSLPPS